jgi:hypothetical protein
MSAKASAKQYVVPQTTKPRWDDGMYVCNMMPVMRTNRAAPSGHRAVLNALLLQPLAITVSTLNFDLLRTRHRPGDLEQGLKKKKLLSFRYCTATRGPSLLAHACTQGVYHFSQPKPAHCAQLRETDVSKCVCQESTLSPHPHSSLSCVLRSFGVLHVWVGLVPPV